jgi:lipid-A-disaccharide synthase
MIKKIFIIAGEASGDLLGSKILKQFNLDNSQKFVFSGVGGQLMQQNNFVSIFPLEDLSVMGFFEVLPHIPKLINRINFTVKKILEFQPDYILTIDSPDFCFRVIKKLSKRTLPFNVKKIHLIAPSVWAYRENRAQKIAKLYDLLLAILPFEPPYFEKYGLKTKFIGHPIIDDCPDILQLKNLQNDIRKTYQINQDDKVILLTPGSRIGEVKRIFPVFIDGINLLKNDYKNLKIIILSVKKTHKIIEEMASKINISYQIIDSSQKKSIFSIANFAIAKSGTNTIEISLYKIPLIIGYRINRLTHIIAKRIIKIKFANLLNLIANRYIIPELLQYDCTAENIYKNLKNLIENPQIAQNQIDDCQNILKNLGLGTIANPSQIAVEEILKL